MAWNEPGGSNKDDKDDDKKNATERDPWSNKQRDQGPPNLDEVFKRFSKQLNKFFSGGSNTPPLRSVRNGNSGLGYVGLAGVFFLALLIWALSGIYIVGPADEAAILRFGRYVGTVGPGPHWFARFINTVYVVNVKQISTTSYTAEMLTRDTNILDVQLTVQYRVDNLRNFLFNVTEPVDTLEQATASAVRQVIGQTDMDQVLAGGRSQVREDIQKTLESTLTLYKTGIVVTDVNLQLVKPPQEVAAAFDDAIKAHEDGKRYINEADAYKARIIPLAEGEARQITEIAQANSQKLILEAQAEIVPFNALLPQYIAQPQVTQQRMYLETMQAVFGNSTKVLIDSQAGNMIYLPLDKMIQANNTQTETAKGKEENDVLQMLTVASADSATPATAALNAVTTDKAPTTSSPSGGRSARSMQRESR